METGSRLLEFTPQALRHLLSAENDTTQVVAADAVQRSTSGFSLRSIRMLPSVPTVFPPPELRIKTPNSVPA